jgi:hypothetical protein
MNSFTDKYKSNGRKMWCCHTQLLHRIEFLLCGVQLLTYLSWLTIPDAEYNSAVTENSEDSKRLMII